MKSLKFLTLILAFAMMVVTMAACGKEEVSVSDIFQSEPNHRLETVPTSMAAISELNGYTIYDYSSSQSIDQAYAVLYKRGNEDNVITYKVFSHLTGEIVASFTSSVNGEVYTEYEIIPTHDALVFLVDKRVTDMAADKRTRTRTLYDVSGQVLLAKENNFSVNRDNLYDLLDWKVFENTIYEVNEKTGALTQKGKLPASLGLTGDVADTFDGSDSYIYREEYSGITVYDYDFNVVAVWTKPANTEKLYTAVLSNGDLLIRYTKALPPDADKYDLYEMKNGLVYKYDLVTEIFSVADKTSRAIAVDGEIQAVLNKYSCPDDYALVEGFENMILVCDIVDGQLSESPADVHYYILDSDGQIGSAVAGVEHQVGMPHPYADGYYMVYTLYGSAIVDTEGRVITQIGSNADAKVVGDYLVDENGIYDLMYRPVYDLTLSSAEVLCTIDNTVFVMENVDNSENYSILAFCGGNKTVVYTYNEDDTEKDTRFVLCDTASGLYAIADRLTGEYTYYNANGTSLLTTTDGIDEYYTYADGSAILAEAEINGENIFYMIK